MTLMMMMMMMNDHDALQAAPDKDVLHVLRKLKVQKYADDNSGGDEDPRMMMMMVLMIIVMMMRTSARMIMILNTTLPVCLALADKGSAEFG